MTLSEARDRVIEAAKAFIQVNHRCNGIADEWYALRDALDDLARLESATPVSHPASNDTLDAPAVAWESFVEVLPRAEREIWARFCGYDGIYRWLHPTENRWVDEPEQIGMPLFKSYQEAKAAIAKSPEPPTWKEYVASLPAPPPTLPFG